MAISFAVLESGVYLLAEALLLYERFSFCTA